MALGRLRIPLDRRHYFVVTGGPYHDRPDTMVGVKMAAEINRPADISIPTRDFCTPDLKMLDAGLLHAAEALVNGDPLYVGCMGGKGRTGLFLAVLAKALGVKQPVEFVRKHYYAHAVETSDQYQFVTNYTVPAAVKALVQYARRRAQWYFWTKQFWFRNLTRKPGKSRFPRTPVVARGTR